MNVVRRCADALNINTAQALGHLVSLWSWLADESETGHVASFTNDEIESAAGWNGEIGLFAKFVRSKHTVNGRIRDWDEYMGPLVAIRKNARTRMRERRQLQKQQDVEADREFGAGGSGGSSSNNGDVSRTPEMFVRTEGDVHTNNSDVRSKKSTRIELRKSIRTTGMYLCRELDIQKKLDQDVRALESTNVISNKRDVYSLYGHELVRAFCRRFYDAKLESMLDVLQRLRAVLRPAGIQFQGQTVTATPELLCRAMQETLANPPAIDDAAIVFVLKKLVSGALHEVKTADGTLVTEAMASQGRLLGREIGEAFVANGLTALTVSIGRPMPTDPRRSLVPNGASHRQATERHQLDS